MIKGRLWLTRSATVFYLSRTKNHQFYLLVRLFKIGETPLKKSGVYGGPDGHFWDQRHLDELN